MIKRSFLFGIVMALVMTRPILGEFATPVYPVYRGENGTCVLKEDRSEKHQHLLCLSVKVSVSGAAGSGTICHYDKATGLAYVISCGHLWDGSRKYGSGSPAKAKITVWYHDGRKLDVPRTYDAEGLFWSNERGYDMSLLRFRPDWSVAYAPITPDVSIDKGEILNSMGCDGGSEVARYGVEVIETSGIDITTNLNSPRPGRSGGGLLTDDGRLVGVCWGTSDISSGDGTGFFTPAPSIKKMFEKNGHLWLIDEGWDVWDMPILDQDGDWGEPESNFVPVPMSKRG